MKKAMVLALASLLVLALVACKGGTLPASSLPPSLPEKTISAPPVEEPAAFVQEEPEPVPLTMNPLTGEARPEGMLPGQRAVAVMVATNSRALPQRGLAAADVVYEMVTEAGIPRLMALYSDYRTVPQVGPVRSTRDQFVQLALPQDVILTHIGSSVYGGNLLQLQNTKTLDGITLGTVAFWFDRDRLVSRYANRGSEYCWYTDASLLWNGMERQDVLTTGEEHALFRFAKTPASPAVSAYSVRVVYSPVGNSSFHYNEATGLYDKNMLDISHADEDGAQLSYKNVLVLRIKTGLKIDGLLPDFDFSKGDGYYFTAGGVVPVQWQKGQPTAPLRIADEKGEMLQVQPGKTFVAFVPQDADFETIAYAPKAEAPAASQPAAGTDAPAASGAPEQTAGN